MLPKVPEYEKSEVAILTFLLDNYDKNSDDIMVQRQLNRALAWEKKYVEFMLKWTDESDPKNTHLKHMEVAFNSERSIEDELQRETYGDIMTIAISYLMMFVYITFSLGKLHILTETTYVLLEEVVFTAVILWPGLPRLLPFKKWR